MCLSQSSGRGGPGLVSTAVNRNSLSIKPAAHSDFKRREWNPSLFPSGSCTTRRASESTLLLTCETQLANIALELSSSLAVSTVSDPTTRPMASVGAEARATLLSPERYQEQWVGRLGCSEKNAYIRRDTRGTVPAVQPLPFSISLTQRGDAGFLGLDLALDGQSQLPAALLAELQVLGRRAELDSDRREGELEPGVLEALVHLIHLRTGFCEQMQKSEPCG